MQSSAERKEAIRKFKERKPASGVFAVRCSGTAQVWVGPARNLDAMKNRFWFCLRNGDHPDKSLQTEWNLHGEPPFRYEILEKLDEDVPDFAIADLLTEKASQWAAKLGARSV